MSGILGSLPLDSAEACKCWLVSFEALCRNKKLEDTATADGNTPKADKFLELCGTKSLLKIISLFPGEEVDELEFSKIKAGIVRYIEPKRRLVIADRTNFMCMTQTEGETVVDYLSRLNEVSVLCKWEDMKSTDPAAEMIKLKFVAGLRDEALKVKVLEKLQVNPKSTVQDLVDFCQMNSQLANFVNNPSEKNTSKDSMALHVSSKPKIFSCNRCGTEHLPRSCPAFNKKCKECSRLEHFAKCCRNKHQNKRNFSYGKAHKRQTTHSVDVFGIDSSKASGLTKQVNVLGKTLDFQLDTGAAISLLSKPQWEELGFPTLEPTDISPTNFDGSVIETLGELRTEIVIERKIQVKFIVVNSNKRFGLIGRDIIDHEKSNVCTYSVENQYLPTVRGFTASIVLKDEEKPLKFCPARPVPVHLRDALDTELEELQNQGIISPVEFAKAASPVVWIKKPNGRFRLCVDFKATLNSNIMSDAYPLPRVEEIMSKLESASKFAKIDMKSAYWQIALDDKAKELSVINTHKGLFVLNRLQMGMKNASAIFQRCVELVLKGIQNVIVYQDDIMIFADSATQLKKRLIEVKKRLREHNFTLNDDKCIQCTDSLSFLGYIFSKDGLKPDESLVTKITETNVPKNHKELSRFLGMVTYFAKFIPKFSEICTPLYQLKANENFCWTEECTKSFATLKHCLVNAPVLQPFSLYKESVLSIDASEVSLGAVLTQDDHPVIYISKTLSPTESRYSNIEREALAVVWAAARLEQFLIGKKFIIQTDHKPLVYILNPNMQLKRDISPRLLRFAVKMMQFDYEIRHIAGSKNVVADSLSRSPDHETVHVPQVHFSQACISADILKSETNNDRFLTDLKTRIITGRWGGVSRLERPFKRIAWQLSIDDDDLIRVGSKIVPPASLYRHIFENAHQTHNGALSTLKMVQKEFFWPNMRFNIECFVKSCDECRKHRLQGPNTTHSWPKEETAWSRLHVDWAYTRSTGNVLIIADSFSGWLEATLCKDRTTDTVIEVMRAIFARFGVPQVVVTDNAPEFAGGHLKSWLNAISCRLVHSPEYRPSSNGLAERMVRVLKDGLKFFNSSKCSISAFVHRLLFVHRNSAVRNGKTPAELMFNYSVRCPILSHFLPSQDLWYKPNSSSSAVPVKFLFRKGMNTSLVSHPKGQAVVAHDNQLSPRSPASHELRRSTRERRPVHRYPDVDPRN